MKKSVAPLLLGLVLTAGAAVCGALAQPAPPPATETVIVNGRRIPNTPNAIAHEMIRTYATPSVLLDAIPRWRVGICPRTDGLSSRSLNDYVTARIRAVAQEVGAPLKPWPCKANLEVVFSETPQAILDDYRRRNPDALGYHGVTKVSHAVQAWYDTGTTDINGQTMMDHDTIGHVEFTNGGMSLNGDGRMVEQGRTVFDGIPQSVIEGWKGRPELTSDIVSVLIIADSQQTGGHKLGAVADHIAMLALSRTEAYDTCEIMPSVANEMANCDPALKPAELSLTDTGFLRGVYKMDAGASLIVQEDDIAGEMVKAEEAGK